MDKPKKRVPKGRNFAYSKASAVSLDKANIRDVTIRDVAGHDVNTTIVNNYYFTATPHKTSNYKIDTIFSRGVRALLEDKLWEAMRLFELVHSLDPHYPKISEYLAHIKQVLALSSINIGKPFLGKVYRLRSETIHERYELRKVILNAVKGGAIVTVKIELERKYPLLEFRWRSEISLFLVVWLHKQHILRHRISMPQRRIKKST